MTIVYKITKAEDYSTRNNTIWGENVTHTVPGGEENKCGLGWLHAYKTPLQAVIFYLAHLDGWKRDTEGSFPLIVCWEAEADIIHDLGDKLLCTSITTKKIIPLPVIAIKERINILIKLISKVVKNPLWLSFAAGKEVDIDEIVRELSCLWTNLDDLEEDSYRDNARLLNDLIRSQRSIVNHAACILRLYFLPGEEREARISYITWVVIDNLKVLGIKCDVF